MTTSKAKLLEVERCDEAYGLDVDADIYVYAPPRKTRKSNIQFLEYYDHDSTGEGMFIYLTLDAAESLARRLEAACQAERSYRDEIKAEHEANK